MNIELTPRAEQLVRHQLARGPYRTPEEVIQYALESLAEIGEPSIRAEKSRARLDEFRAFLDALAVGSEKLPSLPSSAFSREDIYRGHP
jgi:Arc/MetJ-type ribon-helix-helix transcriptional regulator